ncbi:hypothetical protein F3Y22_tig00110528pilonHSYRG00034 [Hibiscus syriacus]|uniref:Uncharacterized protein n=1 Tax=Hibiscus syriacus TaxID=106335 RepID=A0A6A3AD00_HIBSY|nr:hypothetical protein F3Y22_tig00110528pilonHSYRG00034 [Hibiscus syriacus]
MSIDDINASYNLINLDHIFEDVDPLSEWLQVEENPLLDGENIGVFLVDTSYDEMNFNDQSQQQNLSHSSSSATPSQSCDGLDGGGLNPIDDDDRQSGDGAEFRSFDRYREEYVYIGSGHFHDRSQFEGNMSIAYSRERSEPRARSKGKGKDTIKYTFEGSSSGRRSASSNHGVPYQPQMYPPPPMYHPPPPYIPKDQVEITLKMEVKDLILLVITVIGETATTPFLMKLVAFSRNLAKFSNLSSLAKLMDCTNKRNMTQMSLVSRKTPPIEGHTSRGMLEYAQRPII